MDNGAPRSVAMPVGTRAWHGAVTVVVAGWATSVLAMLIGAVAVSAVFASMMPLVTYIAGKVVLGRRPLDLDVSLVVLAPYMLFFPLAGAGAFATDFALLAFAPTIVIASEVVVEILIAMGLSMTVFVVVFFAASKLRIDGWFPQVVLRRDARARLGYIAAALVLASWCGLGMLIVANGGIWTTAEKFIVHSRNLELNRVEQFGLMLWITFHAPAVWFCIARDSTEDGSGRRWMQRMSTPALIAATAVATVVLFGSRTQLFAMVLGGALVFHLGRRRISTRSLVVSVPVALALSVAIILWRTGRTLGAGGSVAMALIANASHSILDALVAIHGDPGTLAPFVLSPERWLHVGIGLIPRFVWPSKPSLSVERLDAVLGREYGGLQWIDTGFPSSFAGEWLAVGGWGAVVLVTLILAVVCGVVDRWARRQRGNPVVGILYAGFSVSAFTYFKNGDVVMSAISTYKMAVALVAPMIIMGVAGLVMRKDTIVFSARSGSTNAQKL